MLLSLIAKTEEGVEVFASHFAKYGELSPAILRKGDSPPKPGLLGSFLKFLPYATLVDRELMEIEVPEELEKLLHLSPEDFQEALQKLRAKNTSKNH